MEASESHPASTRWDIWACGQGYLLTPDNHLGPHLGSAPKDLLGQEAIGLQGTLPGDSSGLLGLVSHWGNLPQFPSYSAFGLTCGSRWAGDKDLRHLKACRFKLCYVTYRI